KKTRLPVFLPASSHTQPLELSGLPAAIETPSAELTCSTVRSEQGSLDAITDGENSITSSKRILTIGISIEGIALSLARTLSDRTIRFFALCVCESTMK